MQSTGRSFVAWLALVAIACSSQEGRVAPDRDPAGQPAAAQLDPAAVDAVRRMSATLAALKDFRFDASARWDELLPTGLRVERGEALRYRVRRPNGLRVEFDDARVLAYDGTTAVLLDRTENFYARMEVPGDLDAALDALAERADFPVPLADFLFRDPAKVLLDGVKAGSYLGIEKLGGVEAEHVVFSHEGLDWQLWIARGERPLPLRICFTHTGVAGEPQFAATLSGWQTEAELKPSDFAIDLPEGAEQIEFRVDRGGEEEK